MYPIDCSQAERILITRIDRIGDVVLSTAVFPAIKRRYPKSQVAALVSKETEAVVRGNPWIDDVIAYDKGSGLRSWLETVWFGWSLKKNRFNVVIHLHPTNRVNIISWLASIPIRIGYRRKNYYLLTHVIEEKKWQGKKHEADYNFDLLALIGVPKPDKLEFYFPLVDSDKDLLNCILPQPFNDRYVVFHPSASCKSKKWAPDRLARVADQLVRDYGVLPVIIGGRDSGIPDALNMQEFMEASAVNLLGKLNLGMLGWLLKGARLLISNDSGPVHIASALGTPVISIFGRRQPGLSVTRWRPLSSNSSFLQKDVGCVECFAHLCQIDFKCLKELKAEEVIEEARQYESFLV